MESLWGGRSEKREIRDRRGKAMCEKWRHSNQAQHFE